MSPSIDVEEPQTNSTPVIDLGSLNPPDDLPIELDTDTEIEPRCTPAKFTVGSIIDDDPKDTLYARFIIDWHIPEPDEVITWNNIIINPNVGGDVVRTGPSVLVDLEQLTPESVHTLRFIVSDRPPDTGGDGMQLPDGSDGEIDWYQWTFIPMPPGSGFCLSE